MANPRKSPPKQDEQKRTLAKLCTGCCVCLREAVCGTRTTIIVLPVEKSKTKCGEGCVEVLETPGRDRYAGCITKVGMVCCYMLLLLELLCAAGNKL